MIPSASVALRKQVRNSVPGSFLTRPGGFGRPPERAPAEGTVKILMTIYFMACTALLVAACGDDDDDGTARQDASSDTDCETEPPAQPSSLTSGEPAGRKRQVTPQS